MKIVSLVLIILVFLSISPSFIFSSQSTSTLSDKEKFESLKYVDEFIARILNIFDAAKKQKNLNALRKTNELLQNNISQHNNLLFLHILLLIGKYNEMYMLLPDNPEYDIIPTIKDINQIEKRILELNDDSTIFIDKFKMNFNSFRDNLLLFNQSKSTFAQKEDLSLANFNKINFINNSTIDKIIDFEKTLLLNSDKNENVFEYGIFLLSNKFFLSSLVVLESIKSNNLDNKLYIETISKLYYFFDDDINYSKTIAFLSSENFNSIDSKLTAYAFDAPSQSLNLDIIDKIQANITELSDIENSTNIFALFLLEQLSCKNYNNLDFYIAYAEVCDNLRLPFLTKCFLIKSYNLSPDSSKVSQLIANYNKKYGCPILILNNEN